MTTANWLTVGRILLIPVFIICLVYYKPGEELFRYLAFWIFIVASFTDALDGYIARRFNQKTELGALLDPLADKLLLVSGFVGITLSGAFELKPPLWIVIVIFSREIIITLALILFSITGTGSKVSFEPNLLGKATTVFQMATLASILLVLPISPILWHIAVALTICSCMVYLVRGGKRVDEPIQ